MSGLRLADLGTDGWRLRSGEQAHRDQPSMMRLPTLGERRTLRRGTRVKLIFEIFAPDSMHPDRPHSARVAEAEDGSIEQMWVDVIEVRLDGLYLGVLRNQPFALDANDEGTYLRRGAEVPFGPEHVIDINTDPVPDTDAGEITRRWSA